MNKWRFGQLVRVVRTRRGLLQTEVAREAGVSASTVSRIETGQFGSLSIDTLERVAAALEIRTELTGRWHGSEGERLLNRRHSLLADAFVTQLGRYPEWKPEPEVSFSVYGERGSIDCLAWNARFRHLLVVELKTAIVDVNELLGTLDRKTRLGRGIAHERGWDAALVSTWLIILDSSTNRRHVAEHGRLLRSRFRLDGRSFASFLHTPANATTGMGFCSGLRPEKTKTDGGALNVAAQPFGGDSGVSKRQSGART